MNSQPPMPHFLPCCLVSWKLGIGVGIGNWELEVGRCELAPVRYRRNKRGWRGTAWSS